MRLVLAVSFFSGLRTMIVPDSLRSAACILEKAFGERIPDDELEYVFAAFTPHLSFRNTVALLGNFNADILSIEQYHWKYMPDYKYVDPDPLAPIKAIPEYGRVATRLKARGYDSGVLEQETEA